MLHAWSSDQPPKTQRTTKAAKSIALYQQTVSRFPGKAISHHYNIMTVSIMTLQGPHRSSSWHCGVLESPYPACRPHNSRQGSRAWRWEGIETSKRRSMKSDCALAMAIGSVVNAKIAYDAHNDCNDFSITGSAPHTLLHRVKPLDRDGTPLCWHLLQTSPPLLHTYILNLNLCFKIIT